MHPPDEGRSNAEDHRTSFVASVPVVVHITYDPAVGSDYRACSGGGHSQEEHRLAAQELSYTGTQDLTAISLSVEEKNTFFPLLRKKGASDCQILPFFNHICSVKTENQSIFHVLISLVEL